MAQNVTLLGASYADVPAVQLPKTGGGTALFADPSITTAVAADVAQGKNFLLADGSIGTGTASGGGGASNIVTGTFKGTTTNTAMSVDIPYTGSGYPIAIMIFVKEGPYNDQTGSFYSTVKRYVNASFCAIKQIVTQAPNYGGGASTDKANVYQVYKSSSSAATTYSTGGASAGSGATTFSQNSASGSGVSNLVKMSSATKMSVFIAGTSYGFLANTEYTYYIVYSS